MITKNPIHYEILGQGLPFLFMHGLGGTHQQSKEMLNPINGVRKILVDCPAHGQSFIPEMSILSFNYLADELIALMDNLKIRQFLVGGISMGSAISMNMMVRYPDRILGAILIRPAWLDHPHPYNLSMMEMSADLLNHPDPQQLFESSPEFIKLKKDIPNAAKSLMGQFSRPQGISATINLLHAMINDAPLKNLNHLSSFTKPVCIIINQKDPMHPAIFGYKISEKLSNSQLSDVFPKYLDAHKHHQEAQDVVQKFIQKVKSIQSPG